VKDVASYLSVIKALIIAHPQVTQLFVVREEAQGNIGLLRYRLTLRDGGLLELFERFQVQEEPVKATKYSFHWQDAEGHLRKRWDNVAHHPELETYPHHIHDGAENNVYPHEAISIEEVLTLFS
jgi:hypothetical protein